MSGKAHHSGGSREPVSLSSMFIKILVRQIPEKFCATETPANPLTALWVKPHYGRCTTRAGGVPGAALTRYSIHCRDARIEWATREISPSSSSVLVVTTISAAICP